MKLENKLNKSGRKCILCLILFVYNLRNSEQSHSAVRNRAVESISLNENITDAFHDLYDAIEKIEIASLNKSASSFAVMNSAPGPSFGDLRHMNKS